MTAISLSEMERHPGDWVRRVEAGETLLVMRDDRAVAEIKPVAQSSPGPRPVGLAAGAFVVPEDFDKPLPADILDLFEGTALADSPD